MGLPKIGQYELPQEHELPAPRAPWKVVTGRAALLIHDMQHHFLDRFTPDVAPIAPVIERVGQLARHCRALGMPVFYTAQEGDQDRRDRGLQADLWGPGMGWDRQLIIPALTPEKGDHVLVKHRYSAFQRSNLETLMRARGRDQLIICGVYAHIGCLLTAAEAFMRDIEPFFVADALADFSRERHDMAVRYVAEVCGVPICTQRLIGELR
ncbi:MAG TPA: isochorismatase family protein [Geminicoccus sp.]|uniref:isochorismatase family protein n=1 Tax=Geminicoccus sp. TaxID=2024832 RepID=UPI002CC9FE68|nr:isochorismatase family protein [Geminicoccus sp.]HWL67084.1 isochorismatase family protein [Geminicoccus sp.]